MWPDFAGGSIFNLMQDIVLSRGGRAAGPGLRERGGPAWREARTVVLLVLDGVGMTQLDMLPADSFLRRHCVQSLTSVFPSTTATAVTTFMTARAPAVHGVTGWHVRAVEEGLDGRVLAILPVSQRGGVQLPVSQEEALQRMCPVPALFGELPGDARVVSPADIAHSPFNLRHSAGASVLPCVGLDGMFEAVDRALNRPHPPAYVYAYWPDFDHCAHMRGCSSGAAKATLYAADAAIAAWADSAAARHAALLVTADHGFIDAPAERLIELEHHPDLAACIDGPLSGERRAVFCHAKPGRARDFERAVLDIEHACVVWRSEDLLQQGRFGPPEQSASWHPKLRARLGDYTLEMKADWTLRDTVEGERPFRLIGVHGGTSGSEMRVPLIALPPR